MPQYALLKDQLTLVIENAIGLWSQTHATHEDVRAFLPHWYQDDIYDMTYGSYIYDS